MLEFCKLHLPSPVQNQPGMESHRRAGVTEIVEPHSLEDSGRGEVVCGWEKARLATPFVSLCHTTL